MKWIQVVSLAGAVAALSLASCKKEESGCMARGATAEISGNHGHTTNIAAEHIRRGVGGTYPVEGADHAHVFVLKDEDMKQLALGNPVKTRSSSVKAHVHEIEVHCK